jgi:hypothetical protein
MEHLPFSSGRMRPFRFQLKVRDGVGGLSAAASEPWFGNLTAMHTDRDAARASQGSCPNVAAIESEGSGGEGRLGGVANLCRGRSRCWWLLVAALVVIRMAVVSRDEIVPINDDSENYAFQAQNYLARPPLGRLPEQPPGLAWMAIAAARFGVPFKLALDVVFVAVCIATSGLLCRLARSELVGSLLLVWLLFNPWFINSSVLFMTEPLTAILVLAIAAATATFAVDPLSQWGWRETVFSGLLSSYFALVRQELALLVCFWVWVAVITALKHWSIVAQIVRLRIPWRWGLVFVPIVCVVIGTQLVKRVHLQRYGVAAVCVSDAPGLRRLLNALYMIEPEQKIRYAPVTRQSLAAACDVSPALNEVRNELMDERKSQYATAKLIFKLDGEFGTWLNWLLVSSFGGMEFDKNQKMQRAADEVLQALRDGRLKRRSAAFPIDPLLDQWKGDVVPTLGQAFRISLYPTLDPSVSVGGFENRRVRDIVQFGYFDDRLMRRHGTRSDLRLRISARMARGTESEFQSVRIRLADGTILGQSNISRNSDGYPQFNLEIPYEAFDVKEQPKSLVFSPGPSSQYDRATIELPEVSRMQDFDITASASAGASGQADKIETWRIKTSIPKPGMQRPNSVQRFLNQNYFKSIWLFLAVLFVVGLVNSSVSAGRGDLAYFLAVASGLYFGRIAMYTLLHAWTHWGIYRYIETNHLLLIFLMSLVSLLGGAYCRAARAAIWPRPARD